MRVSAALARQLAAKTGASIPASKKRGPGAPRVHAQEDFVAQLELHLRARKLAAPQREVKFHERRGWKFDLAWPSRKLACEVDGGVHSGGRHVRGKGFEEDAVKCNEALLLGWRVLRVTTGQVKTGEAADWVAAALRGLPEEREP